MSTSPVTKFFENPTSFATASPSFELGEEHFQLEPDEENNRPASISSPPLTPPTTIRLVSATINTLIKSSPSYLEGDEVEGTSLSSPSPSPTCSSTRTNANTALSDEFNTEELVLPLSPSPLPLSPTSTDNNDEFNYDFEQMKVEKDLLIKKHDQQMKVEEERGRDVESEREERDKLKVEIEQEKKEIAKLREIRSKLKKKSTKHVVDYTSNAHLHSASLKYLTSPKIPLKNRNKLINPEYNTLRNHMSASTSTSQSPSLNILTLLYKASSSEKAKDYGGAVGWYLAIIALLNAAKNEDVEKRSNNNRQTMLITHISIADNYVKFINYKDAIYHYETALSLSKNANTNNSSNSNTDLNKDLKEVSLKLGKTLTIYANQLELGGFEGEGLACLNRGIKILEEVDLILDEDGEKKEKEKKIEGEKEALMQKEKEKKNAALNTNRTLKLSGKTKLPQSQTPSLTLTPLKNLHESILLENKLKKKNKPTPLSKLRVEKPGYSVRLGRAVFIPRGATTPNLPLPPVYVDPVVSALKVNLAATHIQRLTRGGAGRGIARVRKEEDGIEIWRTNHKVGGVDVTAVFKLIIEPVGFLGNSAPQAFDGDGDTFDIMSRPSHEDKKQFNNAQEKLKQKQESTKRTCLEIRIFKAPKEPKQSFLHREVLHQVEINKLLPPSFDKVRLEEVDNTAFEWDARKEMEAWLKLIAQRIVINNSNDDCNSLSFKLDKTSYKSAKRVPYGKLSSNWHSSFYIKVSVNVQTNKLEIGATRVGNSSKNARIGSNLNIDVDVPTIKRALVSEKLISNNSIMDTVTLLSVGYDDFITYCSAVVNKIRLINTKHGVRLVVAGQEPDFKLTIWPEEREIRILEGTSAVVIERVWRGCCGRKVVAKLRMRKKRTDAANGVKRINAKLLRLQMASAVNITKVIRGVMTRKRKLIAKLRIAENEKRGIFEKVCIIDGTRVNVIGCAGHCDGFSLKAVDMTTEGGRVSLLNAPNGMSDWQIVRAGGGGGEKEVEELREVFERLIERLTIFKSVGRGLFILAFRKEEEMEGGEDRGLYEIGVSDDEGSSDGEEEEDNVM